MAYHNKTNCKKKSKKSSLKTKVNNMMTNNKKEKRYMKNLSRCAIKQDESIATINSQINTTYARVPNQDKQMPQFVRNCQITPPLKFAHSDDTKHIERLYVYTVLSTITCNQKKHIVVSGSKEIVSDVTGEIIKIPVHKCKTCKKVFISQEMWNQYVPHGLMKICVPLKDSNTHKLNRETQLHSYGYRVGATGLSQKERRDLIQQLIITNKMTEFQIVRDLNTDINIHRNNPIMQIAVADWRADLKFVGELMKNNK